MAVIFIPSALAVHDLQFQLDGDTTSTAFSPPSPNAGVAYDWNDIFNVTDNAPVPPATVGTETISNNSANVGSGKTFDDAQFTRDFETNATCPTTSGVGLDSRSTNFCTGDDTTYATGSKDTLGIGNGGWQCNHDNNVNSKIDITNAYVVQYTNPTPDANGVHHKIFYFGVERNVSNGTNDVGVWFLQGGASCSAPSGHLNFTGGHLDGDTLVVAEQTSGGGVSTAKAFRWAASTDPTSPFYGDGGCIDSNDNYNPAVVVNGTKGCNNLPIATGADCKTTGGGDSLCATTNANCPPPRRGTTVPPCTLPWNSAVTTNWLTANGSSVGNTVASPDFFEGGIDITAAFAGHGGTTPSCFSTVAPDTRSSASPTATLFDFTLNQLGGCGGSLTTQENAAASRQIGTDGTISSGTDSATLQITGTPSWGGTLSWYLCGPDVSTCDSNGVNVASEIVSSTDGATSAGTAKSYSTADSGITGNSTATLTAADASAGQYCWHAHFEPNTTSKAAGVKPQDDDGTNECFTVTPRTPTLTTSAHCYDSSNTQIDSACVIGSTLKDTASLTGTANNPNNDGSNLTYPSINGTTSPADSSITWTLYGPTSTGAAQCATAISSAPTPSSVTVSGDNASYGPVSYTTTASSGVGKYEFAASYDPTAGGTVASPNTTAPTSQVTCDTTGTNGEQVTVIGTATSSSKQGWLPNDRITINSTAGTKASGTITVTLYYGALATGKTLADCALATGAVQEFQDLNKTVTASTNSATFITDNTSFYVGVNPATGNATTPAGADTDATHSYFWLIHFVSDQGLTNPPDRCESATITHNDG